MTPSERARAFAQARSRIVRGQTGLMRGTRADLVRLLKEAERAIAATLATQPSEFERWSLPQLRVEVRRAMDEFGENGAARASSAIGRAWEYGEQLVDAPIEAGGVRVAGVLPRISTTQLSAMRAFMVDRIKDIGTEAAGPHAIRWDGRDGDGRAVPPGVYFARILAGRITGSARLTILH